MFSKIAKESRGESSFFSTENGGRRTEIDSTGTAHGDAEEWKGTAGNAFFIQ